MIYRTLNPDDYEQLRTLWLSTPGMGLNTTDDSYEGISRFLMRNPDACFAAVDNGQIVGVIMAGHDGRRGYIYHTAVRSDMRGHGIGRRLVELALDALKQGGITKVALVVFNSNSGGNAFWQHMGFEARDDLVYRNRALVKLLRVDT